MSLRCVSSTETVNNARRPSACAPRDRVIGVVLGELLVVRVVPVFLDCDAVVHRIRSRSCIP